MLCVLVGKSASGKTTIADNLVKKHGFTKIITYTTRPMRDGEEEGKDYYFISKEDFSKKIKERFFLEYKTYKVANGEIWYYGSHIPDDIHEKKYVIILTPNGLIDLEKNSSIKHTSIYIYSDQETILRRLQQRGDDRKEIKRRMERDNEDFKSIYHIVDYEICNYITSRIDEVSVRILRLLNCN